MLKKRKFYWGAINCILLLIEAYVAQYVFENNEYQTITNFDFSIIIVLILYSSFDKKWYGLLLWSIFLLCRLGYNVF